MKKKETTRELLDRASDLVNEHDYVVNESATILNKLKSRKIPKSMKDEFDYESLVDELQMIVL